MPRRADRYVLAYVTAPNRQVARAIARLILRERLAAAANLAPIESLYWWRGKLEHANEVLVLLKTRRALAKRLISAVLAVHPYEVPAISVYPMVDVSSSYATWIDEETRHR